MSASEIRRDIIASLIAIKGHLDQPYPDDSRWTPWDRFVEPALRRIDSLASTLAVVEQERDQLREALWEASLRLREIATTSPNWMEQDAVANSERRMREIAEAAHRDAEAAALAVPSSEPAEEQG